MDMKSLLEKMDQLSQVEEAKKGLPPWLKKDDKSEKADKEDKDEESEDKEKVDEAISIQADGAEATSLLDILKLAGQPAPEPAQDPETMAMVVGDVEMAEEDDSFANSPDEHVADMDAAIPSGNDMHKEKDQFKHNYRGGDNPMAMREEVKKLEGKLAKMFESMSKE